MRNPTKSSLALIAALDGMGKAAAHYVKQLKDTFEIGAGDHKWDDIPAGLLQSMTSSNHARFTKGRNTLSQKGKRKRARQMRSKGLKGRR